MTTISFPTQAQTKGRINYNPPRRGTPSRTIPAGTRLRPESGLAPSSSPTIDIPIPNIQIPVPSFSPERLRGIPEESPILPPEGLSSPSPTPSCVNPQQPPLTALIPTIEGEELGTTALANPTLFVYIPETTAQKAELLMLDEGEKPIYQEQIPLNSSGGIVRLSLPEVLEPNHTYNWELALICNEADRNQDVYVQGNFYRLPLTPWQQTRLDREPRPLPRAQFYAEKGLWLDTLATLYWARPQEWQELLESVGLGEVARSPFTNCCTIKDEH